jgi:hypothetical protein
MGTFGVCQRDGGIEVKLAGVLVFCMYPDGGRFNIIESQQALYAKIHKLRKALRKALRSLSEASGGAFDELQSALQALQETE